MNKNTLIITTLSILAMFSFLAGAYFMTSKPTQEEYPQLTEVKATDHVKWSQDKKVVLIEYADLQCPGCQYMHQLFKELEQDKEFDPIRKQITFVYRHFPLDSIHANAREAAYAAEAASKQGKFFEMSDVLFTKQAEWQTSSNPTEQFEKYAASLKLDVDQYKKDYASKEVQDAVQNSFLSGNEVNVQGTPAFFLDGKTIQVPQTADQWKTFLTDYIQNKS